MRLTLAKMQTEADFLSDRQICRLCQITW